jgi:hypothetical protein
VNISFCNKESSLLTEMTDFRERVEEDKMNLAPVTRSIKDLKEHRR